MNRSGITFLAALLLCVLAGCASKSSWKGYQTVAQPLGQDRAAAQLHNDEGLKLIAADDLVKAEAEFREALEQDIYYAPAHNNLGLVLLRQGEHYEAAWEFQYAAQLTPRSPEPRSNLGLLFESVGQLEQAVEEYHAALEIDPQLIETMGHLARAYVKLESKGKPLNDLLEKLIMVNDDQAWDYWARSQLIRTGRSEQDQ